MNSYHKTPLVLQTLHRAVNTPATHLQQIKPNATTNIHNQLTASLQILLNGVPGSLAYATMSCLASNGCCSAAVLDWHTKQLQW